MTLSANAGGARTLGASIVVAAASRAARAQALALACELQLTFVEAPSAPPNLQLLQTETAVELNDPVSGTRLRVEFTAAELNRYRAGGSGRNPFRRAIGAAAGGVVDATGGLGRDAVHLAALGYRVTALERNPIISTVAHDGLKRAAAAGLLPADNPRWLTGDARVVLPQLQPPAVVYLDPMFPPKRKKSAAVRKEMHFLRLLIAEKDDPRELLAVARGCATERIVVKRPIDAAPLAPGQYASYAGRLVRYDVYRTART